MKYPVRKGYEQFFFDMCEWNKKKNLKNYKALRKSGTSSTVSALNPLRDWHIIKNTISGRYKRLEKEMEIRN